MAEAAEEYGAALRLQPTADRAALAALYAGRAAALQRPRQAAAAERDCDRAIELDQARCAAQLACCCCCCCWSTRACVCADSCLFSRRAAPPQSCAKAYLRRGALRTAAGRAADGKADLKRAVALDSTLTGAAADAGVPPKKAAAPNAAPAALPALPAVPSGGELPHAAPGIVRDVATAEAQDGESGAAAKASGLRTLTPRAAGELLLAEPPFAAVVLRAARGSVCHACFAALPEDAAPCAGCAAARFCSAACAAAATAPGAPHARECGGAAWPAALPGECVLAARLARRVGAAAADDAAACASLAALPDRWRAMGGEERLECALLAAVTAACGAAGRAAASLHPAAAVLRALLAVRAHAVTVRADWEPHSDGESAAAAEPAACVAAALFATSAHAAHAFARATAPSFAPGGVLLLLAAAPLAAGAALTVPHAAHPFAAAPPPPEDATADAAPTASAAPHAFACACASCVQVARPGGGAAAGSSGSSSGAAPASPRAGGPRMSFSGAGTPRRSTLAPPRADGPPETEQQARVRRMAEAEEALGALLHGAGAGDAADAVDAPPAAVAAERVRRMSHASAPMPAPPAVRAPRASCTAAPGAADSPRAAPAVRAPHASCTAAPVAAAAAESPRVRRVSAAPLTPTRFAADAEMGSVAERAPPRVSPAAAPVAKRSAAV